MSSQITTVGSKGYNLSVLRQLQNPTKIKRPLDVAKQIW